LPAASLAGSLILSNVGGGLRLTRLMIVACVVWYVMLFAFAQMPRPSYAVPCLIAAGIMQSFSMVSLQIMLLREAGERFRGRVMGVRMMAIYSLPLGLLAAGPLIDWVGWRGTAIAICDGHGLVFHDRHCAALARGPVADVSRATMYTDAEREDGSRDDRVPIAAIAL
jgi:hypothetical protein